MGIFVKYWTDFNMVFNVTIYNSQATFIGTFFSRKSTPKEWFYAWFENWIFIASISDLIRWQMKKKNKSCVGNI